MPEDPRKHMHQHELLPVESHHQTKKCLGERVDQRERNVWRRDGGPGVVEPVGSGEARPAGGGDDRGNHGEWEEELPPHPHGPLFQVVR